VEADIDNHVVRRLLNDGNEGAYGVSVIGSVHQLRQEGPEMGSIIR
jgi:hypothetical protein